MSENDSPEKKPAPLKTQSLQAEAVSAASTVDWGGFFLGLFTNGLVGKILNLVLLVVGEVFEAKKRARESSEQYELDQKAFLDAVSRAEARMLSDASRDYKDSQDVEDRMNTTPVRSEPLGASATEETVPPRR